jgi:hypothetical protein
MAQTSTITQALATLILNGNVPLEAVAIAGEVITIDARISSFDKGAAKRASLEKWSEFAEAYDVLLRRTQSAADDFAQSRDGRTLIQALGEIKEGMIAL